MRILNISILYENFSENSENSENSKYSDNLIYSNEFSELNLENLILSDKLSNFLERERKL